MHTIHNDNWIGVNGNETLITNYPLTENSWVIEMGGYEGWWTNKMVKQHNKLRLNYDAMSKMIAYHSDYHLKPVWDGEDQEALKEIMGCIKMLDIPQEKVWFMPAGDSREALFKSYPKMFDWVRDNGYRLTWRPHIIAFEDKREV